MLTALKEKKVIKLIADIKDEIAYSRITHEKGRLELESLLNRYPDCSRTINRAIEDVKAESDKINADADLAAIAEARRSLKQAQWELNDVIEQNTAQVGKYLSELSSLDEDSREYKQKRKLLDKFYKELAEAEDAKELIENRLEKLSTDTPLSCSKLSSILTTIITSIHTIATKAKTTVIDISKQWSEITNLNTLSEGSVLTPYEMLASERDSENMGVERIDIKKGRRDKELDALISAQKNENKELDILDQEETRNQIAQVRADMKRRASASN